MTSATTMTVQISFEYFKSAAVKNPPARPMPVAPSLEADADAEAAGEEEGDEEEGADDAADDTDETEAAEPVVEDAPGAPVSAPEEGATERRVPLPEGGGPLGNDAEVTVSVAEPLYVMPLSDDRRATISYVPVVAGAGIV